MVDTYINGSIGIIGAATTKQFTFLVVKDTHHISLPQSDIDTLGLKPSLFATPQAKGGHARTLDDRAYEAGAHFDTCYIELDVRPEPTPTLGAQVLRELGFEVDLERGQITKPAKPLKLYRGLMPSMLDMSDLAQRRPNDHKGAQSSP